MEPLHQHRGHLAAVVPTPSALLPISHEAAAPHTSRQRRWVGVGFVTLAGASYGVQSVLAKVAYDGGMDVPTVLAVRFGVASVLVWIVVAALRRHRWLPLRVPPRTLLGFGVLGLLFVTNALFGYLALTDLTAGTTTLLIFAFPALVVLWSRLLFGERLGPLKLGCLVLALTGCALTVDPLALFATGSAVSLAGVGWALLSALSNSWYATLAGPIARSTPGLTVAAYSLPVTAACFLVYLVSRGGPTAGASVSEWLACIAIGALAGLSVCAVLSGIARIGSSQAAIVSTSEPATAVLLGALVLSEPLKLITLLGGACIAAAIVLLSRVEPTMP